MGRTLSVHTRGGARGLRKHPRLQQSDLNYLGVLGVNVTAHNGGSVAFTDRVCAPNRATGTGILFDSHISLTVLNQGDPVNTSTATRKLCELNIAGLTPSLTSTLENATILQQYKDLTYDEWFFSQIPGTDARPLPTGLNDMNGGALCYWSDVFNEWRWAHSYTNWYEGGADTRSNVPTWWTHSVDFTNSATKRGGFSVECVNYYGISKGALNDGFACDIPLVWQPYFGGNTHIISNSEMSILGRTSPGRSAFVMKMQDFDNAATYGTGATSSAGSSPKIPATQVIGFLTDLSPANYRMENRKGTRIDYSNKWFNAASKPTGIFFPEGYSSVCFVGSIGRDITQYASGGFIANDFVSCIWCYDVWDLIAVYNGLKAPHDVYCTHILDLPRHTLLGEPVQSTVRTYGAAYNPDNRTLYYKMRNGTPLINVLTVAQPTLL